MGHGVVVEVEAQVGRLAHRRLDPLVGGEDIGGQGQQPRSLLLEGLADGERRVGRAAALGRRSAAPGVGLGVEPVEVDDPAAGD